VSVDPRAAAGFAVDAARYERVRPSYPDEAVARLAREFGLTSTSTVLDLAAGTGKLTRLLVPLVGRAVAVEPSDSMREVLRETVPQAEAVNGTAEAIPLDDAAVDAVFVAEAFHWFRTAQAGVEIARVLAPGGGLALLWNRPASSERDNPWLPALRSLIEPLREAAGPMPIDDNRWERQLEELARFRPLSRAEVENGQRLRRDEFVELISSWTWIANLEERRRASVLGEVRDLLRRHPLVQLRYTTELYWTTKV
jgi:SAM-dependent methyltransferase